MNLERFLQFWSAHNQTIIQVLIVLTLVFIVALVFITLFGSKEADVEVNGSVTLSADLEKSLQKMLETQITAKSAVFDFSKGQATDPQLQAASGEVTAEAKAEIERAKAEIVAREKTIQDLKAQLVQVSNQAAEAKPAGDSSGLESKIKELEARLAEYDIISEDIADLSRYKEENEKLKAQLQNAPAAPAPASAAAAPAPAPAAPAPVAPPELKAVESEPTLEQMVAEATAVAAPAAETTSIESSTSIDDDLMKEFAAAVEGQKAAKEVPPPPPAVAASPENEDLMGQFEDFVQKKEGS